MWWCKPNNKPNNVIKARKQELKNIKITPRGGVVPLFLVKAIKRTSSLAVLPHCQYISFKITNFLKHRFSSIRTQIKISFLIGVSVIVNCIKYCKRYHHCVFKPIYPIQILIRCWKISPNYRAVSRKILYLP